ncbi:MAG: DNA-binding protein [Methanothrix sp.]|nr:DNA-binding protein [Methanothrix sp.]
MAQRNKLEILERILDMCRSDGVTKTKIVYQINLNFKNAGSYLEWLTEHGYLIKENRTYKTTTSGLDLLQDLNGINSIIRDEETADSAEFSLNGL